MYTCIYVILNDFGVKSVYLMLIDSHVQNASYLFMYCLHSYNMYKPGLSFLYILTMGHVRFE